MPHLRILRRSHGLTILAVAQRSGLSTRAIAELEYGLRPLEDAARLALARVYDLAPGDLETPLAAPASLSWRYLANILSQQVILATLISTLMVSLLFGGAIYGADSHPPVPSERAVTHVNGLGPRLSKRYVLAPTSSSRRRPNTTLPHDIMERAILAVAPTMTPTATPRLLPSATPRPAPTATPPPRPTEVSSPLPTDVPSPVPAATLQLAPTEMPSAVPTEMPSLVSTEAPNLVPTDTSSPAEAPGPAPTDAPSPTPVEAPSPAPTDAPSPTPVEAPSPAPTDAPSPAPTDALSPAPPEAPNSSGGAMPQSNSVFMPLPADGPFHQNVVAALDANNGALQHVVIPPNGVWSFNRTVGDPDLLQLEPVYGVYGGGWCDLASRYTMVLRPLLPLESFEFIRHIDSTGFGLEGVPDADAVVIWNSNGADGEQDLRIHNPGDRTISIRVTLVADGVQFQATIQ